MTRKRFCCAALAAATGLILGSAFTAAAAEWTQVGNEWAYVENNGEYARDVWKTDASGKQYYLGSDGFMLRNSLIEYNGGYYYVNSAGEMTVNNWKLIENQPWQDETSETASWYYFGSNGRAYVTSDGNVEIKTIGDLRYAFDRYGRMLTGWFSDSGDPVADEDWANATYYGDGDGAGNIVTNSWVLINVPDSDNETDSEPLYHFFFGSNGKKTVDTDKTISDKKYHFDNRGVAIYGWNQVEDGWRYYGTEEDPSLRVGWFQAVPDESLNAENYASGIEHWYYAASKGDIAMNEFRTVDSKTYAFNEYGEMITGLKRIATEDKVITSISDIESLDDLPTGDEENVNVFYFATGDGSVRTGTQSVVIEGTTYSFNFKASGSPKGAGYTGMSNNHIYDHGRCLTAEDGSKYEIVDYGEKSYLVNESGAIQKSRKNAIDSDGYYYCTKSDGTLIHGPLNDKCDGSEH